MSLTYSMLETNGMKMVHDYQNSFKSRAAVSQTFAEEASAVVVNRMIEDLILEVTSDIHRSYKLGYYDYVSPVMTNNENTTGTDCFDVTTEIKTEDINCPKCNKMMHPSYFASHLNKCMHGGRSSSRKASQRIANNSKECSFGGGSDEEEERKTPEKSKNVKKFDGKRKKDSARKQKPYKPDNSKKDTPNSSNQKEISQSPSTKATKENVSLNKNSKDNSESELWISPHKVTPLLSEDKIQLFASKCGVKSDHTGKYCGRSLRCHRHTDTERAVARKILTVENSIEGMVVDEIDNSSKNVLGNFSSLNINPTTPVSKKKEKQRQSYSKF